MASFSPQGTLTAIVTPFTQDGSSIDWDAYERHVGFQIEGGVSGIVPCGTTGEAPTLSSAEQIALVTRTVKLSGGRVSVMAGTGSASTQKAVSASRAAEEAGAHAVMVVVPYYNKPSQEGLLQHFETVASAVGIPVVLYNVPGRSSINLKEETLFRILDRCRNVVAIKDATNNVLYCQNVLAKARDRVAVICGDDALTVPLMSVGATGVVSVTSNVLPRQVSDVVARAQAGDFAGAASRHLSLLAVHSAMFCAPSPVPAKVALAQAGRMTETVRLPLTPATSEHRAIIASALEGYRAAESHRG